MINVALAILTACSLAVVLVLFPDVPSAVKVLSVLGVLAIGGLAAAILRYALTRDYARLTLFAALRGWTFTLHDADLDKRFDVFPMNAGLGGRVINVMRGSHRFYEAATFTYLTAMPAPQVYQVTLIELGAHVPTFQLLPEDAIAAAAKLAGGQDILVGDADFDKRWRIIARDPDYVRAVLTPQLRERLDKRDVHGMPIVVDGGAVLTWKAGPEAVRRLSFRLEVLVAVAEAIPESVWKASRP